MHSDIAVIAVAGLFVALGGFVQSGIGLGLGLIGAPIVTLLAPALMPGSMLVAGASLPVLILAREALHTDWPGVSWALAGRVAGTAGGIWVLAVVSRGDPFRRVTPGVRSRRTRCVVIQHLWMVW